MIKNDTFRDSKINCRRITNTSMGKCSFRTEFSELDGPKPLLTIPVSLKTDFDLNAFAVLIMSAGCASIMQTTEFPEFNIPGHIQV